MVSVTTLSFDIATAELFLPLTSGGKLVIASREVAADGARLAALLKQSKATFMQPTPITWQLLRGGWKNRSEIIRRRAVACELAARLVEGR
jgi:non-ribosomal peptide synthetase component F